MLSSIASWFRSITDYELVWCWRIFLLFAATITATATSLVALVVIYVQLQMLALASSMHDGNAMAPPLFPPSSQVSSNT